MALILEVKGGRFAGKKIAVPDGSTLTIGRAPDRANFAVPHDSFMSSVHFAVECGADRNRIQDRKSSNGTYLNGARITEAVLSDGDEIRSGRTVFVARIIAEEQASTTRPAAAAPTPSAPAPATPSEPPETKPAAAVTLPSQTMPTPPAHGPVVVSVPENPPEPPATEPRAAEPSATPKPSAAEIPPGPALITVGSWRFAKVPEQWEAQGEFGIQRAEKDAFPSNVVATEEMLGIASLQRFVEAQVSMLRQYLREPRIEAALPPPITGAEETVALDIRYSTKDEQVILLRRIFARQGKHVGVLTFTTLEKDLEEIRPALDAILASASFQPKP